MPSFEILTLFPRLVEGPLEESILGKARQKGLVDVRVTDIRDFAEGRHRICDDAPYGGGAGMVMKVEPLVAAIEAARARQPEARVVLMGPRGRAFDQKVAKQWLLAKSLVLVCGRYEGVDERVLGYVDEEVSVGDFILTGGELAALCVVDAVARLMPGVLGNQASAGAESFEEGRLEHPQYTRPPEFRGQRVPEVLLSGDHGRVGGWRRAMSLKTTRDRRPDLFAKLALSDHDWQLLKQLEGERDAQQDP